MPASMSACSSSAVSGAGGGPSTCAFTMPFWVVTCCTSQPCGAPHDWSTSRTVLSVVLTLVEYTDEIDSGTSTITAMIASTTTAPRRRTGCVDAGGDASRLAP